MVVQTLRFGFRDHALHHRALLLKDPEPCVHSVHFPVSPVREASSLRRVWEDRHIDIYLLSKSKRETIPVLGSMERGRESSL